LCLEGRLGPSDSFIVGTTRLLVGGLNKVTFAEKMQAELHRQQMIPELVNKTHFPFIISTA
jgi:hypothetical protein